MQAQLFRKKNPEFSFTGLVCMLELCTLEALVQYRKTCLPEVVRKNMLNSEKRVLKMTGQV